MTSDIRLAFAHPSERAAAMAGDETRDRISLRDHIREVEIGAFLSEDERKALFAELSDALRQIGRGPGAA